MEQRPKLQEDHLHAVAFRLKTIPLKFGLEHLCLRHWWVLIIYQVWTGADHFIQDLTNNVFDKVIQTWSVNAEDQAGLDQLKRTHQVNCLKVFDINDSPVPPHKVSALLKGANTFLSNKSYIKCFTGSLVEVHFSIRHWSIYRNNQPVQHAFSCMINQICILKWAPPPKPSPYKGSTHPYRPLPTAPTPVPAALMHTNVVTPTASTPIPIEPIPAVVASDTSDPSTLLPPTEIQPTQKKMKPVFANITNVIKSQTTDTQPADPYSSIQLASRLAHRGNQAFPATPVGPGGYPSFSPFLLPFNRQWPPSTDNFTGSWLLPGALDFNLPPSSVSTLDTPPRPARPMPAYDNVDGTPSVYAPLTLQTSL